MIGFLSFLLPLTLFLSFPSTLWNFDGVACAMALELGQPAYWFHANHLLYGFLGFLFWHFVGLPIGIARALPALQLFTSLLAAAGLIGLYRLAHPILKNGWIALLLTLTMAVTAAFWVWSVEAQVYPLGFFWLAWAAVVLVQDATPGKYWRVGLFHAAAVLGHLMHILWVVPAIYWMRGESGFNRRALLQYLTALAAGTGLPYAIVLITTIMPGRDWNHILIWLKGSAGLTADRGWAWHDAGWIGPWIWLKSIAPGLWGSFWPYAGAHVGVGLWLATALSAILLFTLVFLGSRPFSNRLNRFAWLWLGVYGVFLSTWEPATLCYRMTDVLPLGILAALGLRKFKTIGRGVLVSLLLMSTFMVNITTRLRPMGQSENNPLYQDALTLSKITSPDSLYITGGGFTWIYLLYFTGRQALNARSYTTARLAEEMARQKHQRPVYVQSTLLSDPAWAPPLQTQQKLKPLEKDGSWLQVQ